MDNSDPTIGNSAEARCASYRSMQTEQGNLGVDRVPSVPAAADIAVPEG